MIAGRFLMISCNSVIVMDIAMSVLLAEPAQYKYLLLLLLLLEINKSKSGAY